MRLQQYHDVLTFCLVWVPAPGHSVMISSLASLFVANANATPEKVVPKSIPTMSCALLRFAPSISTAGLRPAYWGCDMPGGMP